MCGNKTEIKGKYKKRVRKSVFEIVDIILYNLSIFLWAKDQEDDREGDQEEFKRGY